MEILYIMYFGCFKYVHNVWGHKIDLTIYVHTIFPNPGTKYVDDYQISRYKLIINNLT